MSEAQEVFKQHVHHIKELGVTTVVVSYNGDGDSGAVETVSFWDKDGLICECDTYGSGRDKNFPEFTEKTYPNVQYMGRSAYTDPESGEWVTKDTWAGGSLVDLVAALVYCLLPGGWEINEGSMGEVTIDLTEEPPTVEISHGWHVTAVEHEDFSHSL